MEQGPGAKRGIADSLRRLLDQREDERSESGSQSAVLTHKDDRHVVRVLNLSTSGAMIRSGGDLAEGDEVTLQLLDHGPVAGQVRWVRGGHVGVEFTTALDGAGDQL